MIRARMKSALLSVLLFAGAAAGEATTPAGPLATITVATTSLAPARLFYEQGLGLTLQGPIDSVGATRGDEAALWGLPAATGWREYLLTRAGVADAARIRLLVLDFPAEPWRSNWDPAVPGPYTIGFPNVDQAALDAKLRALGFGARNPMERTPFTNEDGRSWEILETVHTGPDFVAAVGIARGVGNPPISPVDARGIGGPAYSMMVVADLERMSGFMHEVLGYEIRNRRVQTSSGTAGAMNTPDGTQFELAQMYPPDAKHGFVILIQFRNLGVAEPARPPRLPATGIVMYSFPVAALEPVLERAARAGATGIVPPRLVDSAAHGRVRHASFVAPNGVRFELVEAGARKPGG